MQILFIHLNFQKISSFFLSKITYNQKRIPKGEIYL